MREFLRTMVVGRCERRDELFVLPRLHDEVEGSALHAFYGQLDVRICREKYHLHIRTTLLDLREPVQTLVSCIDVGVEVHVQKHYIRTEFSYPAYQFVGRGDKLHLCEMNRQEQLQRRPDSAVVVHDQYLSFALCHNLLIAIANLINAFDYSELLAQVFREHH